MLSVSLSEYTLTGIRKFSNRGLRRNPLRELCKSVVDVLDLRLANRCDLPRTRSGKFSSAVSIEMHKNLGIFAVFENVVDPGIPRVESESDAH